MADKKYGSMVDVIPAKGGMGPGGVGNIEARSGLSRAELNAMKSEAIKENVQRDIQIAKQAPERKTAMKNAETETKDGVKVTKYPYVEPSVKRQNYRSLDDALQHMDDIGMKKGGKVSSASSRADGCAQRGKTKGRLI
jgi:hypothetical protein